MAVSIPRETVPEAREFRDALGRFATGVVLVTAAPEALERVICANRSVCEAKHNPYNPAP